MTFSAVAASAGRLFVGALRYIGGGISAFAKGAAQNAKEGTGGDEQKLSELIRMREKFVRTFGNLNWYWLLLLFVVCLTIGLSAAAIEIKNLQALLESIATEGEKSEIFGVSTPLATAALILIAESVFGFVIFAAKYSIPLGLRIGVSITAWSMAVIIISGNFTTLQKRDAMVKRAAENQRHIVEMTRRSQVLADRAMANAETAVKATEKNGATSATRAGAVAAANAAEVAREQSIMTRQVADQLRKAPPPSNDEVQGEFWARVLKMLGAVTMFAIQAYAMRLSGLFALMSRQEYVAGRKEVDGAPNLKLPDFTKRKPLPDPPAPAPAPLPRVDYKKLKEELAPEPVPTVPQTRRRIEQGGFAGTADDLGSGAPAPTPARRQGQQNKPRNQTEPVPEPIAEPVERLAGVDSIGGAAEPEPVPVGEIEHRMPDGSVIRTSSIRASRVTEPVLRAIFDLPAGPISVSLVSEAMRKRGQGVRKGDVTSALAELERVGILLPGGPRGSREASSRLEMAKRKIREGESEDDVIKSLTN